MYPVGTKLYANKDKRPYTVRVADDRFAIATKSHFGTVMYTILDKEKKVCGPDNMVFSHGYETIEDCEYNLRALQGKEPPNTMEVSYRRAVRLDVRGVDFEFLKVVGPDGESLRTPYELTRSANKTQKGKP